MAEATLTMRPLPWARMVGTTARTAFHTPVTFTASTRAHSASGISSKGCGRSVAKTAALLTRTSIRWKRATVACASARRAAGSATSARWASTRSGCPSVAAAASGSTTSPITTRAPSAMKRRA
jgi:hypothetical protein